MTQAPRDLLTLINTLTLKDPQPGQQDALISLLSDATEQVMRHQPGFVSARFHRSLCGTRVVNHAQWLPDTDLPAVLRRPEVADHLQAVRALADTDTAVYTVASTHSAPSYALEGPGAFNGTDRTDALG